MQAKDARGPILLPLLAAGLGVALLLENFLLLGGFRVSTLLPLVLVALGAWILIRGDLGTRAARTFGITRGSVQSATLEVSAGEVDVILGGDAREGRLVEGQFSRSSRRASKASSQNGIVARTSLSWASSDRRAPSFQLTRHPRRAYRLNSSVNSPVPTRM